MGILPHSKVYPTNESVEDPPEGLLEEVPSSRVEEEAPTHAKVASRTSENAAPEGPVEELPRDEAEKEFPSNTKVASGVSDHGTYSGVMPLLRKKCRWSSDSTSVSCPHVYSWFKGAPKVGMLWEQGFDIQMLHSPDERGQ
ncbi:hypothetical protein CB1_000701008 [Camelus ferus]|nr:hypothetical protein CB1_002630007 [Camelus ferus]EPY81863.1 hypothetical protein CB1_000701008 [Camelus ferus]